MQHGHEAYRQTTRITTSPRDLEAQLLLRAAAQLQNLKEEWSEDHHRLNAALHYNRRLWTVFVSSVARADNPLPQPIKNNIATLGAFIFKQTLSLQSSPAPEKLNALIAINREIASGLHAAA